MAQFGWAYVDCSTISGNCKGPDGAIQVHHGGVNGNPTGSQAFVFNTSSVPYYLYLSGNMRVAAFDEDPSAPGANLTDGGVLYAKPDGNLYWRTSGEIVDLTMDTGSSGGPSGSLQFRKGTTNTFTGSAALVYDETPTVTTLYSTAVISASSTLHNVGAATLGSTLSITGAVSGASTIHAVGAATFGSTLATSGNIDTAGDMTAATITMTGFAVDADGDTNLKSLKVDNGSTVGCDADGDMLTFNGNAAVPSVVVASNVVLKTGRISGSTNANIVGATTLGSTLNVSGATTLAGDTTFTGDLSGSGDLLFMGTTRLGGTLRCSGSISSSHAVGVSAFRVQTANNQIVLGVETAANYWPAGESYIINYGHYSGSKSLVVGGPISGSSTFFVSGAVSGGATLQAVGATTLGNVLNVTGGVGIGTALPANSSAQIKVAGPFSGSGTLHNVGAVTIGGTLATSGNIDTTGDMTAGTVTMSGFSVSNVGITAVKSLKVDNGSTIGCAADTDMLTFDGNAAPKNLVVASDVWLKAGIISGSNTISSVGSISSSADLAVSGAIHAATYYGDGSNLSGIAAGSVSGSTRIYSSTGIDTSGYFNVSGAAFLSGGVTHNHVMKNSSTYTIAATDYYVGLDTTSTAITVTLPQVSAVTTGKTYVIKDEGGAAGTNNITIEGAGSEQIDGQINQTITTDYEALSLYCGGARGWFIF